MRHSESVETPSASVPKADVCPSSPADSDVVVVVAGMGMGVANESSPSYSPSMASEQLASEKGNDVDVPGADGGQLGSYGGPSGIWLRSP